MIYPFEHNAVAHKYLRVIKDDRTASSLSEDVPNNYSDGQYIFHQTSSYSGFTVIAAVDKSNFMRPIYDYVETHLFILLFVCFCHHRSELYYL